MDERHAHMAHSHTGAARHHHHDHTATSQHIGGHHLLNIEGLTVGFSMYDTTKGTWTAEKTTSWVIQDLNISVHVGEIVAIVGASGSGKTLMADAIMGLFAPNAQVSGDIYFDGELQDAQGLARLRGNKICFVPQSVKALDPLMKVGKQVGGNKQKRAELFARYGLDTAVEDMYPFELSGGMARRVLLCTALINDPAIIVADEPTPGLDLPLAVQAMQDFREFANTGGGVLLITHDIELALEVADRVAVFKDGTVVEEATVEDFQNPETLRHPFSKMLWHALPTHDFEVGDEQ